MPSYPSGHTNHGDYSKLSQDSPDAPIDQRKIIDNLNGYLAWHHFPIGINYEGTCLGLSTVYAKYVLEGRRKEFMEMLITISDDLQPNSDHDNFINHFAVEVALTQFPAIYEPKLTQRTSIQCLEIEGDRLYSSFDFSMSTRDDNWSELIHTLDLKADEPMLVTTVNHCICVTKEQGKYCVYDPNYKEGIRFFEDETAVIKWIRFCQNLTIQDGQEPDKLLNLHISVIRHPALKEQILPSFPSPISLYEKYLTPERIDNADYVAVLNKNLCRAVLFEDEATINRLIELGATDLEEAAGEAVYAKNANALRALLPKITDDTYIAKLIETALRSGSADVISLLSMHKTEYEKFLSMETIHSSICSAARSNDHRIIERLLLDANEMLCEQSACDENISDQSKEIHDKIALNVFKNLYGDFDHITAAILGGVVNCVRTLITFADSSAYVVISEETKYGYLVLAIEKNQAAVVSYLITTLSPDWIQGFELSAESADKTELSILRQLVQHGVPFSPAAEANMMQKENQVIPLVLKVEIIFRKYTDFMGLLLYNIVKLGSIYAGMFRSSEEKSSKNEDDSMSETDKPRQQ